MERVRFNSRRSCLGAPCWLTLLIAATLAVVVYLPMSQSWWRHQTLGVGPVFSANESVELYRLGETWSGVMLDGFYEGNGYAYRLSVFYGERVLPLSDRYGFFGRRLEEAGFRPIGAHTFVHVVDVSIRRAQAPGGAPAGAPVSSERLLDIVIEQKAGKLVWVGYREPRMNVRWEGAKYNAGMALMYAFVLVCVYSAYRMCVMSRAQLRAERARGGLCAGCGFPVMAGAGVCSECGAAVTA